MLVEHPISNGATAEQWVSLVRSTGVRIKDETKIWGPLRRRDFLNWLENEHSNRMPQFFDSREAASKWLEDQKASSKIEEQPDFLEWVARAKEIMRERPDIGSAGLAEALGISSKLYAHTIKVFVNAQQEGA